MTTEAERRAAESVAGVVQDIEADVIPSFGGVPVSGDLPPPTRSVDDIQIQLERPEDRPTFAERVARVVAGARPRARAEARDRRGRRGRGARGASPVLRRRARPCRRSTGRRDRPTAGRARRRHVGAEPRRGIRRGVPGDDPSRRGAGRPGVAAHVRVRPDRAGPRRAAGRRLRPVAAPSVGARRDDRRDPPRRAQQRDRRRAHGRRDRDPRRALRPGVAPPAQRRRAPGATPAAGWHRYDDHDDRARRGAPPGPDVRRRPGSDPRRRRPASARGRPSTTGETVIVEGAVEDHLFAVVAGSIARAPRGPDRRVAREPARPSASSPRSSRSPAPHR